MQLFCLWQIYNATFVKLNEATIRMLHLIEPNKGNHWKAYLKIWLWKIKQTMYSHSWKSCHWSWIRSIWYLLCSWFDSWISSLLLVLTSNKPITLSGHSNFPVHLEDLVGKSSCCTLWKVVKPVQREKRLTNWSSIWCKSIFLVTKKILICIFLIVVIFVLSFKWEWLFDFVAK